MRLYPAWQEEDLGIPLPDSPHACSVCLPTWKAVLGYEEARDKVVRRMRMGYPRFFRHPLVARLTSMAAAEIGGDGEEVFLFPTRLAAQRAQRWIEPRGEVAVRQAGFQGLQALAVPVKARQVAVDYQRFTGELVSSRHAEDIIAGTARGGNKTHLLQRRLGKIAGTDPKQVHIFNSGMAAITAVLRSLPGVKEGRKTLQIEFPYVDALKVQELFGNGVVFLNQAEGESFDEALRRIRQGEFAGVFTEAPSNPLLRTADIPRLAAACAEGGTPLMIDDSSVGPSNVSVLRYADVVTSSLTKWMSGTGDVMAGMAVVRPDSPFAGQLLAVLAEESGASSPLYVADAEVLLSNLKGYPDRMAQHNANGDALAAMLAAHPAVGEVWHPSLVTRENYDRIKAPRGGYGPLLSFVLKNPKKAGKVFDALKVTKGPSFGTPFTLACPYTLLAHYRELDWADGCGVPPELIRVSCGTEETSVLLAHFAAALELG
ncbi:PLP-dependent transferase [Luteolibacter sp. Populi]|uniref:PLP-dependent transferase n=1 Tax=Luteolibacter sp. Populi TaxID=3230487 RepID=UPI003465B38D